MPGTILQPFYYSAKNQLFPTSGARFEVRKNLSLAVAVLLTMVAIYFCTAMVIWSAADDELFRRVVPGKIVELIYYAFFVLLLVSNIVAAMGNIYNSHSMELLLVAPISNARLYLAKLIETTVESGTMFYVLTFPIMLAYTRVLDASIDFVLVFFLVSIPFLVIPAAIGIILGTLFTSITSFVWKRGALFVVALIGTLIWLFYELVGMLQQIEVSRAGDSALLQFIGLFGNPSPVWLPSRWAADAAIAALSASEPVDSLNIKLLFATMFGISAVGFFVFDFFMLPARSRTALEHKSSGDTSSDWVRRIVDGLYGCLPVDQQMRAVATKDISMLLRDRAQSLQLLLYLGLAALYLVFFTFLNTITNFTDDQLRSWVAALCTLNVLLGGFVTTAIATRLVYPAVSLEGQAFWILIVTPVDLARIAAAKFTCWLPVIATVAISLIGLGAFAIGATLPTLLLSIIFAFFIAVSSTGLAVGIGAVYAKFKWESPNQVSSGFGSLSFMIVNIVSVVLYCIPITILIHFSEFPLLPINMPIHWALGIGVLSAGLTVVAPYLVARWGCRIGARLLKKHFIR